jgi:hypothetical protein
MADDDDGADFDVDLGDTGAEKGAGKAGADEVDDELEDLSREELYDRLKNANTTAKKYRLRLKRARQGSGGTSDRDDEDDDRGSRRRTRDDDRGTRDAGRRSSRERDDDREDDDDRRPARRSSRADESEERAVRAEAKVALAAAGIPADRLTRAVRLIDLRSLELDGDDLLGIEEEIEDLRDEWPELFKRSRSSRDDDDDDRDSRRDSRRDSGTRRRVSRADTRAGGGTGGRDRGNKQKSSTEIAAEQLLGQIGR